MSIRMKRYKIIIILISMQYIVSGQIDRYKYIRPIIETSDTQVWQKIDLPIDLYSSINGTGSDIRIYQITINDTIERPYIFDGMVSQPSSKKTAFQLLNQTKTQKGRSFTFRLEEQVPINEIKLNLENRNFDWKVQLEGSHDQKSWATILDDYRIVALNVPTSKYRFTDLLFPTAKFEYYRITVLTEEEVKFQKATLSYKNKKEHNYLPIAISNTSLQINKEDKTTIINLNLKEYAPIDLIKINVNTNDDYYRPFNIEAVSDSSLVNKKWNYHYQNVYRGTLSSIEENIFPVNGKMSKAWRITIKNHDNPPLEIETPLLRSRIRSLYTKTTSDGKSYLYYGNSEVRSPNYDLKYFKSMLNLSANKQELGKETINPLYTSQTKTPLINDKWWLWGLLVTVIIILGWASLNMIKGNSNKY